jgi:quinol monooxygenase YgiN
MFRPILCLLSLTFLSVSVIRADESPVVTAAKKALSDPAKSFAMTSLLKVKAGKEKEFEAAYDEHVKATRAEKGCLAADLYRDPERAGVYLIHERWKDVAALSAHMSADHTTAILKKFGGWLEASAPGKFYTVVGE